MGLAAGDGRRWVGLGFSGFGLRSGMVAFRFAFAVGLGLSREDVARQEGDRDQEKSPQRDRRRVEPKRHNVSCAVRFAARRHQRQGHRLSGQANLRAKRTKGKTATDARRRKRA
jgi:hypothetical protein